jgi:hypothetical protein
MENEQTKFEYKGVEYTIAENGLVTEYYRKREAKLKENTTYLDSLPVEEEVALCMAWLEQFATPRKTVNPRMGSYGLKHVVERWAGNYVSNGAFILAAHRLGY